MKGIHNSAFPGYKEIIRDEHKRCGYMILIKIMQ